MPSLSTYELPNSSQKRDVFLCHASEDKEEIVRPIYSALCERGFSVWLDEAEIEWGDRFPQEIEKGLKMSRFVIVVITQRFFGKDWPEKELKQALKLEIATGNKKVLPLCTKVGESKLRTKYPRLKDKSVLLWDNDPDLIATEVSKLLKRPEIDRPRSVAKQIAVGLFATLITLVVSLLLLGLFIAFASALGLVQPSDGRTALPAYIISVWGTVVLTMGSVGALIAFARYHPNCNDRTNGCSLSVLEWFLGLTSLMVANHLCGWSTSDLGLTSEILLFPITYIVFPFALSASVFFGVQIGMVAFMAYKYGPGSEGYTINFVDFSL